MEQQFGVEITFPKPISGYWDRKQKGGTFTPEWTRRTYSDHTLPRPNYKHPGPGNNIRWGCFRLNLWFTVKSGRTWYEAASIAKRRLMRICKIQDTTLEIIEL